MSIDSLQSDTRIEYTNKMTVLMTTVVDMNTITFANGMESDQNSFIMVSLRSEQDSKKYHQR